MNSILFVPATACRQARGKMVVKLLAVVVFVVLNVADPAGAYIFRAAGTLPDGTNGGLVQFGDPMNSTAGWNGPPYNYLAFALERDGRLLVKQLEKPAPPRYRALLWATPDFAKTTAVVSFWLQVEGDGSSLGSLVTGQTWALTDASGTVLASAVLTAPGTRDDPCFSFEVPIVKTAFPLTEAAVYYFQPVPEPSTILALCGGFLSLACLRTRRRY